MFTAHAHTFNVDDHFHLEMIVNIIVIIGDIPCYISFIQSLESDFTIIYNVSLASKTLSPLLFCYAEFYQHNKTGEGKGSCWPD